MGDAGLGIITAWHYDYKSEDARNVQFVKLFNEMHGRIPTSSQSAAMTACTSSRELKKTGGKTTATRLIAAPRD